MKKAISPLHIKLTAFISKLDAVEAAIVIDRLMNTAEHILENEKEVREQMENHFISPDLYLNTMRKIQTQLN